MTKTIFQLSNGKFCPLRLAIFMKSEDDRVEALLQAEVNAGRPADAKLAELVTVDMQIRGTSAQGVEIQARLSAGKSKNRGAA